MTPTLYALIGFVFWTMFLVMVLGCTRGYQIVTGQKKSNEFRAGVPHGGEMYWRLNRAHLNCIENIPLFATVVLTAAVTGASSETMNMLACVYMVARVCQSMVHIASGTNTAVQVRFTFYGVQMFCLA